MTLIQSLILGLVQGVAEFLPISSSAHLIFVPWLLGWQNDGGLTFDVALHLGTLLAILIFFRRDWLQMIKTLLKHGLKGRTPEEELPIYLVLGTIPGALAGLVLEKTVESTFRSPLLIAFTISTVGVALWVVDKYSKRHKSLSQLTFSDAMIVGLAQSLALVPGVSRSGITIMTGLICGYGRESAARFSFLLAMPITAGACLLKLRHLTTQDLTPEFIVGVVAAFVAGYASIGGLIKFLQKKSYGVFAVYRVAVGILILSLFLLGFRK